MYLKLEEKLNWASYLAPFSYGVWISILCWLVIASIVIQSAIRYDQYNCNSYVALEYSTFHILKALCYQGGQVSTSSIPVQISCIMPYILAVVLIQFYSGVLLSHLTVKNSEPPFKDLEGVIEDGSYKISVLKETRILFHFQTDPGAEAAAIRKNLLVPTGNLPVSPRAGFRQLCGNRWVFLCGFTNALVNEKCNIIEIDKVIFNEPLGIVVKKGFPYNRVMTKLIKRLQFAGVLKLKTKNVIIRQDDSKEFKSLSIESVLPLFLFCMGLLLLSCGILICELYVA